MQFGKPSNFVFVDVRTDEEIQVRMQSLFTSVHTQQMRSELALLFCLLSIEDCYWNVLEHGSERGAIDTVVEQCFFVQTILEGWSPKDRDPELLTLTLLFWPRYSWGNVEYSWIIADSREIAVVPTGSQGFDDFISRMRNHLQGLLQGDTFEDLLKANLWLREDERGTPVSSQAMRLEVM